MSIAHTAGTTFLRRPRLRAVPAPGVAPAREDLPPVVRPDLVPTVTGSRRCAYSFFAALVRALAATTGPMCGGQPLRAI